ncbi:MAG TPA: NAD(P)-binding domain-containing protein [Thermoflexales bacterium]|jgi:predicted dinucleotide-binding enzyme|nr:NAD(P)-binding domain-containing protein [Thermoflexales bacterium]HQX11056.1 NAD(P)-binding domain-containing protein [Thermoflexales bacterium]HQY25798.1 NAD(P)-binding domain-containing protein [Thermoflexales bacterium]HQZ54380.1 NAD(P)-binding domain-containing protein [Thermoflexales bacterium]HRA54643.1 NAD(P)-binding domain-containing protein [Thermoflexales bacterium]
MKVGVFGSGTVGQTIAAKVAELGHEVMVGTRDTGKLADWLGATRGKVQAGSPAATAAHGEILFNATNGGGSLEALALAGEANLNGKILIDISNPLDFSRGMPPTLSVSNTDSLGEQIQRAYPRVRVVKTLNTITASLMVNPRQLADGDHHVFISGNDADAKAKVVDVLTNWFGWRHVLDLGDIATARGTEMYLPIWLRMWGALGTGIFNVKIVK